MLKWYAPNNAWTRMSMSMRYMLHTVTMHSICASALKRLLH